MIYIYTVIMRTCTITRARTHTNIIHVYIYIYIIYCIDGTNQIVNGVGLYHVCLRYLNDEIMINHVYRIQIKSMRRQPLKSEAVRSCSMAKPRTVVECCAKL